MSDGRFERLREQVGEAVEVRDTTALKRACDGLPPVVVKCCLGPGRCLHHGDVIATCAFCVDIPYSPGDHKRVDAIAKVIFGGN